MDLDLPAANFWTDPNYSDYARPSIGRAQELGSAQDVYVWRVQTSVDGDVGDFQASRNELSDCLCTPSIDPTKSGDFGGIEVPGGSVLYCGETVRLSLPGVVRNKLMLGCPSEYCGSPDPSPVVVLEEPGWVWRVSLERSGESIGTILTRSGRDVCWHAPRTVDGLEAVVRIEARLMIEGQPESVFARIVTLKARKLADRAQALLLVVHGGKAWDTSEAVGYNDDLASFGDSIALKLQREYDVTLEAGLLGGGGAKLWGISGWVCNLEVVGKIVSIVERWIVKATTAGKPLGPLIVVGHSFGGNGAALAARVLSDMGIGIDTLIVLERTKCGVTGKLDDPARLLRWYEPDVGDNVLLCANFTGRGSPESIVHVVNASSYAPVWCARITTNQHVKETHGYVDDDQEARASIMATIADWVSAASDDLRPLNLHRSFHSKVRRGLVKLQAMHRSLDFYAHAGPTNCHKPQGYDATH